MRAGRLTSAVILLGVLGCAPSPSNPLPKGEESRELSPAVPLPKRDGSKLPQGIRAKGMIDEFGLPLEITLDVPDVPEELLGPSPPIDDATGLEKK